MSFNPSVLGRRQFLQTAAPFLCCGGASLIRPLDLPFRFQESEKALDELRNELLVLVNSERVIAGVGRLKLDELASRVANNHAREMAEGNFISHWGRDGRKPYHRYAFAGGIHATQENIAAVDNFQSFEWKRIVSDFIASHLRMHAELPPNDGHRRAILAPQHTHVGFGLAINERRLRLVEIYVAKYVHAFGIEPRAKRKATLHLWGKLLNPLHFLQQIDVFYESSPKPPGMGFLTTPRSYSLPNEYRTLRPRLSEGMIYVDRSFGLVELNSGGRFRVPVKLFKDSPGVYTIVLWVKRRPSENPFPATEICVETE
jgi:uncharacterized protein YkwD